MRGLASQLQPLRKYEHPWALFAGIVIVIIGICLQLPMLYDARMDHYRLAGMPISPQMYLGMAMIIGGTVLAFYGLFPVSLGTHHASSAIRIRPLDNAPLRGSHIRLIFVLTAAIIVDVMKPTSLAFVAPGAATEYGLRGPLAPHAHGLPIALYPLSGITGTVIGSLLWGWMGDKIGRRASILIASVIFISTCTCATMPRYWLNLVCCLCMGIGAGGMLPIAFTLISETIPARHRGWVMVLIGGGGAGVAYVLTSWIASTIGAPDRFGWRILWLVGMPLGLILFVLNKWIPESPRFLLLHGREQEARSVMERYASTVAEDQGFPEEETANAGGFRQLFTGRFLVLGACVLLLSASIGLSQYGFQQWMPSDLQKLGYTTSASSILRTSSLLGLPLCVIIACMYGLWSSRWTLVILASLNAITTFAFVFFGNRLILDRRALEILLIGPIASVGVLAAVIAVYAAEIYPTKIRSRGSGLAAGATKFGGVLILALAAIAFTAPSIRTTALVAVIPMTLGIIAISIFGPETRSLPLEQIMVAEKAGT